jgi:hypothetical protein
LARQHHRTASSSQLATRDAVVLLGASILAQWSDAAKELRRREEEERRAEANA